MNRFFLSSHLLTGLPASGYLPLLTSGFLRPMSGSNSFNKRGRKTVHFNELHPKPRCFPARVAFEPKHTVPNSIRNNHIEISRGDAKR